MTVAAVLPFAVVVIRRRAVVPVLLGCAFMVSAGADLATAVLHLPQWAVSATYPVIQYGLVYIALTGSTLASLLLLATGAFAMWAVTQGAWERPDAVPRIIGALATTGLLWDRPPARPYVPALVVYFGVGTVCWIAYVSMPGLWPWLAYQACRLVGLGLFTVAVWREY